MFVLELLSLAMPDWFEQLGYVGIILSSSIPFFPVPPEPMSISILAVDHSELTIWNIAVIIGLGSFVSHVIAFVGGRHLYRLSGLHKSIKIKKQPNLPEKHIFHKYGIWLMLIVPTASIFIPPLADALMIYLGHKRVNHMKLFAVVFAGEMIRVPLTFLTISQIILLI
jgi:membrane protein YqaA with SNARE-associated domain